MVLILRLCDIMIGWRQIGNVYRLVKSQGCCWRIHVKMSKLVRGLYIDWFMSAGHLIF
jgi:hypothetical protein